MPGILLDPLEATTFKVLIVRLVSESCRSFSYSQLTTGIPTPLRRLDLSYKRILKYAKVKMTRERQRVRKQGKKQCIK